MKRKDKLKKNIASSPSEEVEKQEASSIRSERFPVVGLGASAGGLAAFEAFFRAMPAEITPGMAFILVQHLAPDHSSILSELIRRYTQLQVFEIEDGMVVQQNCVYIIPPNRDLGLLNGALQLLEPADPRGQRLPIDFFFRSLAQDLHERSIAIVLSGTGSDGALGVRAVKGEAGLVIAQDPASTEFDGMPRSAIATGLVDYVLPPAKMMAELIDYAGRSYSGIQLIRSPIAANRDDSLNKIFVLLRAQVGHDFSHYKLSTVSRRVHRRMAVHRIAELDQYVSYLQENPAEAEALFRDLLIGVTSFFRDPDVFAALEELVIPQLFDRKSSEADIRVWVPGCSTGEEAYSIAILLKEKAEKLQRRVNLQVFATDIDSAAVAQARVGVYPPSIATDILPQRLAQNFTEEPDTGFYRIHKNIRDVLVFSLQNVIKDPPFSKLDLISCRNLLIYMGEELQAKLIATFHYALNPTGFLLLGSSESVGEFTNLFAPMDRKSKLFRRNTVLGRAYRPGLGRAIAPLTGLGLGSQTQAKVKAAVKPSLREQVERMLLQEWAAVAALVNKRGDIRYLHGRSGLYLEPASGEIGIANILEMAREGLRRELTTGLQKAIVTNAPVYHRGLRIRTNGDVTSVNLTVLPTTLDLDTILPAEQGTIESNKPSELFLIIFQKGPTEELLPPVNEMPRDSAEIAGETPADVDPRILVLTQQLRAKDESLRTTFEAMQSANEESKASNEEMQSMNEELQSSNEELETSKEELQSLNEELATVNVELQHKVAELSHVNDDLNNLLAGTGIGTLFVDHRLCIKRFTPSIVSVINLRPIDAGRPISDIVANLAGYDHLVTDVQAVLDSLVPKEVEVQTKSGSWYLLGIRPYRTLENVIEGAVITFNDITDVKKARLALQEVEVWRRLAVVVRDASDAITIQDLEGNLLGWNPAAEQMYGWREAEALTMNSRDLVPEDRRKEEMAVVQRLARSKIIAPYKTQRIAKNGRMLEVSMIVNVLKDETGKAYAFTTIERLTHD